MRLSRSYPTVKCTLSCIAVLGTQNVFIFTVELITISDYGKLREMEYGYREMEYRYL